LNAQRSKEGNTIITYSNLSQKKSNQIESLVDIVAGGGENSKNSFKKVFRLTKQKRILKKEGHYIFKLTVHSK